MALVPHTSLDDKITAKNDSEFSKQFPVDLHL